MSYPAATKNAMLDGVAITHASLHDGYPGATGANEISGVTRQSVVINAASGGQRLQNASVAFIVPTCTVRWVGYWDSATFVAYAPNGGSTPKNFMAIASTDVIYAAAHGYSDDDPIVFIAGTAPTGLSAGTVYYVISATTDSFQVSETVGGAAVNITATAGYQCAVCAITEQVYGTAGTHTLSTSTITIPD